MKAHRKNEFYTKRVRGGYYAVIDGYDMSMESLEVPPKEAFVTWCTFDGYDDRLDSDGVDRWDAVEEYMNKTFGEARLAVMRSLLEKFRAMERSLDSRTAGVILKVYVLALNPKNISLLPAAVEALRKAISE